MRNATSRWATRIGLIALGGCVVSLPAAEAHAQAPDDTTAMLLFKRARAHAKIGEYEKACRLFEESSRIKSSVGTLLNLGDCFEKTNKLRRALDTWQHAVQLGESTADGRVQEAKRRLEELKGRVPRLFIRLAPTTPADTVVVLGDTELEAESLKTEFPVDPGEHVLVVRADGRMDKTYQLSIGEGASKELEVEAGAKLEQPDQPESETPELVSVEKPRDDTLAYVLTGVGAAGVVVAAVTSVMLVQKKSTIDKHCDDAHKCDSAGIDAVDSAKSLVPINYAAWAVGIAGIGTGTALFLTGSSSGKTESSAYPADVTGVELHLRGFF